MRRKPPDKPSVWLVGDSEHRDFAEAKALVQSTANVGPGLPELILFAQSRPGVIRTREVERLRRSAPLAGVVALLGSWCEGETRTGRPAVGVPRLYWYEFPSWWRRQLRLRAAGQCPEWARADNCEWRIADCGLMSGRVVVETARWETTAAIRDVLRSIGAQAVWSRPASAKSLVNEVAAGIWEGGQLNDAETAQLAEFCARLAVHNAPVIALLDFPRRDRCVVAQQVGATAVLGKPWRNADLVETVSKLVIEKTTASRAA
jgi:hypothetical protein